MGCGASVAADDDNDKPKKRFKGGPAPESFMAKSAMNIAAAAAPAKPYVPSHNGLVNEAVVKKDLKASRSKMLAARNAKIALMQERDTRMATGTCGSGSSRDDEVVETTYGDTLYDFVNHRTEKTGSSVETMLNQQNMSRRPFEPEDEDHEVVIKVCQYVCGRKHPPAAPPLSYMEEGLAGSMVDFQNQMKVEIGEACAGMTDPISVTFWELDMCTPNPAMELRVFEITALIVDKSGLLACMVDMNIYLLGDRCSGFTLDGVCAMPIENVTEEHINIAKELAITWDGVPQDQRAVGKEEETDLRDAQAVAVSSS